MASPTGNHDHENAGLEPARARSWLLALDTATDQAGVALFDGDRIIELSWPGGRQQTTSVLPNLELLLERNGLAIDAIGAVAVAAGPGSFTGLRVGLSLAKGLAITGNRAVIGVNTLEIAAMPYVEAGVECIALVPAGRGRVVWSRYGSEPVTPPVNTSFAEFLVVLRNHQTAVVAGELNPEQREQAAAIHPRVTWLMTHRRPGVLARIGYRCWRAGELDDPAILEPLYLHGLPNPRQGR